MNTQALAADDDILVTNLRLLMQQRGITEAELSRQTSIPQPTLHKIFSGKTTDPRISTLQTLATFFGVTLDSLYSDNILQQQQAKSSSTSIPIISWTDCTQADDPTKGLTPNNWSDWIISDNQDSEHAYALISRACMEPHFPRGTILIIDTAVKPNDGDFIVVQYPDTEDATIRELSIDGPNQLLLSLNHKTTPDKLDASIRILGTVIQSRFTYNN